MAGSSLEAAGCPLLHQDVTRNGLPVVERDVFVSAVRNHASMELEDGPAGRRQGRHPASKLPTEGREKRKVVVRVALFVSET